jgi:hypoxanthine phosphoribosyltransferase
MDAEKEILTWEDFGIGARVLAQQVADSGFDPDVVIAIARGGMIPTGAISYALGKKLNDCINVEFYIDENRVATPDTAAASAAENCGPMVAWLPAETAGASPAVLDDTGLTGAVDAAGAPGVTEVTGAAGVAGAADDIGALSAANTLPDPILLAPLLDTESITGKRLLVIDDVVDSGRTMVLVQKLLRRFGAEVRTCVLYAKPTTVVLPDYVWRRTAKWIVFPWSAQPPVVPNKRV